MKRLAVLVSLLAPLSGCVGEIWGTGDNPPTNDPPQDQPPPPPTEVRIAVHDPSGPVAGVAVVFMNPDDSVVADSVTDAQGVAVATMPTGSVTVIREDASSTDPAGAVYTYVGVKAGDKLDLALPALTASSPMTVTVRVPEGDPDAPLPVTVRTPCGEATGAPPEVTVTLDGRCGAMTDFYVMEIGDEYPSAFIKRAPIASTVDLSLEMYRPALTTSLSVANAPIGSTVYIEKTLETDLFRPAFSSGPQTLSPDTLSVDTIIPDLPGVEEQLIATVSYNGSMQRVGKREPYAAAPGMVDLATAMIIGPSAPAISNDMLTWTETGSGAPDLVAGEVKGALITHRVVAPYAGATLRIPHLPASHDAFNVKADDTASIALAKISSGYDGIRAQAFNGPLAPLNGSATVSLAESVLDPKP
ncbi:MAG TPA: carboxypeptidase-like regulatory domain-containing protein [Kofleriaceae bacterium]|jgi:hypothetical protein|nr:carboxypeptidase-like regulatory domain-containing protein [Kofleriaceae bacterium]